MSKRKQKSKTPIYLSISGLILIVVVVLLLSTPSVEPTPTSTAPLSSNSHDEETYPEIARVSLAESKTAFDAGTAVFLDVRDNDAYAASHVPGSVHIPLGQLESRLGELDNTQWIITYCS